MRKAIKCDECKKVIGEAEEIAEIGDSDPFGGVSIVCEQCLIKDQGKKEIEYFNTLIDR